MATTVTRQELYDAIWSEAKTTVAKRFGVSDVALGKACRNANIPTPPVGYWARLAVGKKVERPSLPPRGLGMTDRITIGGDRYAWHRNPRPDYALDEPPPAGPVFDEAFEAIHRRAAAAVKTVRMPRTFEGAHPAIQKMLKEDEERRARYTSSRYPSSFDKPKYDDPVELRRLRLLGALFRPLSSLGYVATISEKRYYDRWEPGRSAYIRINNESVAVQIEPVNSKGRKPKESTSQLALEITGQSWLWDFKRRWVDGEDGRLERHLTEIATNILIAAEDHYRSGELWQHERRLEQRQEAIQKRERELIESARRAEQARIAAKRARERQLLRLAHDHQRAEMIRSFVASARERLGPASGTSAESERWAAWALSVAMELDPVSHPATWEGLRARPDSGG
jgi:hypothetical protein